MKSKNNKRKCITCGRTMKQHFFNLKHCKCGMSWKNDTGYFERTKDMVFKLDGKKVIITRKTKQEG